MNGRVALEVNGDTMDFADEQAPANLLKLMELLHLDPRMVVAEVNGDIVGRDAFAARDLGDGDKIELVKFVGGG